MILLWHFFEQFFLSILRFSLHEFIKIIENNAVYYARTSFSHAAGYPGTAFLFTVVDTNPWYLNVSLMVPLLSHSKEILRVNLLNINVTTSDRFV